MNPTTNKRKGARFEQVVADYLSESTGMPVERRRLNGVNDRGDLNGLTVRGRRIVVECKNTTRLDIAAHLAEAERERVNDHAAVGAVVQKRRGIGDTRTGEQVVMMTLETFARLVNIANEKGGQCDTD